jgi:hypothetical protein
VTNQNPAPYCAIIYCRDPYVHRSDFEMQRKAEIGFFTELSSLVYGPVTVCRSTKHRSWVGSKYYRLFAIHFCLDDEGRLTLPITGEDPKDKGIFLNLFCPESRCEIVR